MLKACFECIHYKEPNLSYNPRRFNDNGFCLKYKDYAEKCRENKNKCGIEAKGFDSRFSKIKLNNFNK
jgi:hypothetical protein